MLDAIWAVNDETADLPERVSLADDVRVGSVDIDIITKEKFVPAIEGLKAACKSTIISISFDDIYLDGILLYDPLAIKAKHGGKWEA